MVDQRNVISFNKGFRVSRDDVIHRNQNIWEGGGRGEGGKLLKREGEAIKKGGEGKNILGRKSKAQVLKASWRMTKSSQR